MIHISVAEDDANSNKRVCSYLNNSGFEAKGCLDAEDAYEEIPAITREFNIICRLLSYQNRTFSRAQRMDEFWGAESETGLRAVDLYITKLRNKFSVRNAFEIRTIRGMGYKAVLK